MGRSAVAMRGGRVQELYKNKGDRNETKITQGHLGTGSTWSNARIIPEA